MSPRRCSTVLSSSSEHLSLGRLCRARVSSSPVHSSSGPHAVASIGGGASLLTAGGFFAFPCRPPPARRLPSPATLSRSSFASCTSCPSSPSPSAKCNPSLSPSTANSTLSSLCSGNTERHHRARSTSILRSHSSQTSRRSRPRCHSPGQQPHLWLRLPLLISLLITLCATNVLALSSIRISAPDYIYPGDAMWLNCTADLDYNQIYSIKWFKDNQEMYRFITSDESPTTFYPTSGIVIDETRSNFGNLYIQKTDFKIDANFRCEVLAENDFNTAIEIKKIRVYAIPKDGMPIIMGKKFNFRPNELVNLTCSSPMSTPAARLMVTLNGNSITANSNYYQRVYHTQYDNGQTTTSMNVQFPSQWLHNRKNEFRCTSSIIHRFNRTASVKFDARTDADNRTAYYLEEQHLSLQESNYIRPQFTRDRLEPKIENYRKKYELGDVISLRCISAQHKIMPELYWLVDGVPVDAQFLDFKQNDYHQNGFVRLDLKYRLGHSPNGGSQVVRKSLLPRAVESYTFKCVQVLSELITVSTETAELWPSTYDEMRGNAIDGGLERNSEAVKSLIGNGAQSRRSAFTSNLFLAITLLLTIAGQQLGH